MTGRCVSNRIADTTLHIYKTEACSVLIGHQGGSPERMRKEPTLSLSYSRVTIAVGLMWLGREESES